MADAPLHRADSRAPLRVLLLARYGRLGSTSRLRFYQFLPRLAELGVEVESLELLDDEYVRALYERRPQSATRIARAYGTRLRRLLAARRFDVLWIEKELFPWLPAWAEAAMARAGVPYVVDYDDATFHRYDAHTSRVVRALLGRKIDSVMRGAAVTVVGNEYLAARARAAGAGDVVIVPTVVDAAHYAAARSARDDAPSAAPLVVGWIGSPSTERYLDLVAAPLATMVADGGSRVRLVGATPSALRDVPHERVAWSEETEAAEVRRFDIGIMPVPDEPFERGKCGFKLVQYMACGRPVVASPGGANSHIVVPGESGYLPATPAEWLAALRRLRDDASLRQRMGAAGLARLEAEFTVDAVLPTLAGALRRAASAGRRRRAA